MKHHRKTKNAVRTGRVVGKLLHLPINESNDDFYCNSDQRSNKNNIQDRNR